MLLSLISTLDRMQQNYFHGFFEEQDPLLFRYAVYLMRDHHQAEEALQNAWLQCLTNRDTFLRSRKIPVQLGCVLCCEMLPMTYTGRRADLFLLMTIGTLLRQTQGIQKASLPSFVLCQSSIDRC